MSSPMPPAAAAAGGVQVVVPVLVGTLAGVHVSPLDIIVESLAEGTRWSHGAVALSDAVTLSRHVDGVLLVVKEQAVSRAVVKQTLDMMKAVDANILGVVLNNVDLQRGGSKYKYYYAYRDYYSNYDDQGPSGDSEKAAK